MKTVVAKLLSYAYLATLYPLARSLVTLQSEANRLKSFGKRPRVHFEAPHDGERIVLLALYQKGELRPDLVRLLKAAKAQGLYVMGVNTLRLSDPDSVRDLIDCYIERPNFGRDFGSYKTGFLHLYARGWDKTCPRLLMINDSVYYSTRGLDKFLTDMTTSDIEVLGATENYEIRHHLGSFCIAMAQSILCHDLIKKYWRNYSLTDVRPTVIRRGEMKLSRTLKSCVSKPSQFRALYDSSRFMAEIRRSPELQDVLIRDSRTCALVHWPRFNAEEIRKILAARYFAYSHPEHTAPRPGNSVQGFNSEIAITGRKDLEAYLKRYLANPSPKKIDDTLNDAISAHATQIFMAGSQIHQNAAILLHMGLPIVKMDGMYRGLFNTYDIIRLQEKLNEIEGRELAKILMERPFGGSVLTGWKRAAFMRGLI